MPGMRRPNQDELKRRRRGYRAGTKGRKRRRKFKPFLPLIILGNVRLLADTMDELGPPDEDATGISGGQCYIRCMSRYYAILLVKI